MNKVNSSFRDPSGYCYTEGNVVYRVINKSYKDNYDMLMNSGLYDELTKKEYLIPHNNAENTYITPPPAKDFEDEIYKIIKPEQIKFITYPYEWSFSQLKDAALLTLKIQRIALKYNMSLKDASSYNIQFYKGKPVFIDTLSFEKYCEDTPWIAYNQFCRHFLCPLVLMSYTDIRCNTLLKDYIDGIPIDLTAKLLPCRAKLNPAIYLNIYLQSKYQKKYENSDIDFKKSASISKNKLIYMNERLQDLIYSLKFPCGESEWGDYYNFTNYNDKAFEDKKRLVGEYIKYIQPKSLWDLGANNGLFTRIASQDDIECCAFDIDPVACEKNYNHIKKNGEKNITPILFDLTNPSPSIGWANNERDSIIFRNHPDVIMALALIHHIAISNNVPFDKIAKFFSSLCEYLIIEFVPKEDSKVKKLLKTRCDIFDNYDIENFENDFKVYFDVIKKDKIISSSRTLYLFHKKKE